MAEKKSNNEGCGYKVHFKESCTKESCDEKG